MGVAREYTVAQALKILNDSEGFLVRNFTRRGAGPYESGGHAFGNHLVIGDKPGKNKPAGPHAGSTGIVNRVLNGAVAVSSGWYKKGDMAVRLAQLLNSEIGQAALEVMDRLHVQRMAIHCFNRFDHPFMKRQGPSGNIFDPLHLSATTTVIPGPVVWGLDPYGRPALMRLPDAIRPVMGPAHVVGIHAVLDKFDTDGLHVQTFYPSFDLQFEHAEYEIGSMKWIITRPGPNAPFTSYRK